MRSPVMARSREPEAEPTLRETTLARTEPAAPEARGQRVARVQRVGQEVLPVLEELEAQAARAGPAAQVELAGEAEA